MLPLGKGRFTFNERIKYGQGGPTDLERCSRPLPHFSQEMSVPAWACWRGGRCGGRDWGASQTAGHWIRRRAESCRFLIGPVEPLGSQRGMLWVCPDLGLSAGFAPSPPGRPLGARILARGWSCPGSTGRRRGRAKSKREAIKMLRRRPERKTRPPQISWACGIILIKIIDSYCTCENGKKMIPTLNPTNCLELLDGTRRGCDLRSDLVPGFPNSACLDSFIYYLHPLSPSRPWVAPVMAPTDLEGLHLWFPVCWGAFLKLSSHTHIKNVKSTQLRGLAGMGHWHDFPRPLVSDVCDCVSVCEFECEYTSV